jgi:hypothetical protein
VAAGPNVAQIHEGLMKSPPHRANILNGNYNSVGLAIVGRGEDLYVTQDFAHTLPIYSEGQFRDAVVAAFNKARKAHGLGNIDVRDDSHLRSAACSGKSTAQQVLGDLPGATDAVVFTSSVPEDLPSSMKTAASNGILRRMDIEVCFKPDSKHGYGSFWVLAGFYP